MLGRMDFDAFFAGFSCNIGIVWYYFFYCPAVKRRDHI